MKTLARLSIVIALAGGLSACATAKITTDWDHTVDFSNYQSFSLLEPKEQAPNPLMRQRITKAVTRELEARGFERVAGGGDLLVVIHGHGGTHRRVDVDHYGYGYRWRGWGPQHSAVRVTDIPMGTLIIDLVDGGHKELEWRGVITDSLSGKPDKDWAKLEKAIAKLFAGFPPQA